MSQPRNLSPLETLETVGTAAFEWLFADEQPPAPAPQPAPKRPAPAKPPAPSSAPGVVDTDGSEVQP